MPDYLRIPLHKISNKNKVKIIYDGNLVLFSAMLYGQFIMMS